MSLEAGQSLSHYRLVEKIGEGGMGVVWKAEDTVLGRTVAIKVLLADLSRDEERRRMFFQEAKSASSVSTAHIVQVYEFGREGERDFLVMEYVEGKPLTKLLLGRPLPPHKVAEFGAQIARALGKAHRAKLVHRDLKPGNVLVTPEGEVKVVDFGLATLFRRADTTRLHEATTVVNQGAKEETRTLAGTLPYMSPEQVRLEDLDGRSDIFSLGTILYEMATGQLPFQGSTHSEVMREILSARPVPVHDLVPKVPLELDRIISKAMARRRGERYPGAEDLAVDLMSLGKSLESGTSPSYDELQRKLVPQRRKGWRLWSAAGALALAVVAVAIYWFWPRDIHATLQIMPLEVRGVQQEGAEYLGRQFAEWMVLNLAPAENLEVLQVPDEGGGIEAGVDWRLTGSLTRDGDTVRASLSLVDVAENRIQWGTDGEAKADEVMHLAQQLAREVAAELGAVIARTYDYWANVSANGELAHHSVYLDAVGSLRHGNVDGLRAAVERLEQTYPDNPVVLLLAAEACDSEGEGRQKCDRALADLMRHDPDAPWEGIFRARYLESSGDPIGAVGRYSRVLEREDLTPSLRSQLLTWRGSNQIAGGMDREAGYRDFEKAIELDPVNWWVHRHYASFLVSEDRFDEALSHARRARAIAPSGRGVQETFADALLRVAHWDEALLFFEQSCEGAKGQAACAGYAYVLQQVGREEDARQAAASATALEETPDGCLRLASYHGLARNRDEVIRLLQRRLDLAGPIPGWNPEDQPDYAWLVGEPEFEALTARIAGNGT